MRKFWGYKKCEKFSVGCTGQTVYVYDKSGKELAKFKDIIHAYTPMFCPNKDLLIVKSTAGMLAIYSLDTLKLIKKFRFSKIESQDDGFCFSNDGKYLYNIERHNDSLHTCLSIYDTSNFACIKRLFESSSSQVLSHIEYDYEKKSFYLLGFMRGNEDVFGYGFVAELQNNELINITKLDDRKYEYISDFKHLELMGFTAEAIKWSRLKFEDDDLPSASTIVSLSKYIQ